MPKRSKQILAMSNSSALFVDSWEAPLFGQYLVRMTGKERPVISHIGAANGDSVEKSGKFFAIAQRAGFEPRHLNLFALEDDTPENFFADVDAIYIDGGSTRNLRALLKEWSVDRALRQAYDNGVVVAGASAGANILFDWGMTDSVRTRIEAIRGLGMLPGTISVHTNVRSDRNEALQGHLSGADATYPAFALDDFTALHFEDGALAKAVSSKEASGVTISEAGSQMRSIPIVSLAEELVSDTI